MRRLFSSLALGLVLFATTASAAVPTVAVLPFRDLSGAKASVGEAIRETVTSDLKTLGGVRTAKVDGHAAEFLKLQDKVTAELLRSAGMQSHIKKIVERQRAPLKSMR